MKRLLFGSFVLLLLGAGILASGCGSAQSAGNATSDAGSAVHVVNGAPAFGGQTLGGAPVSLASYRGKPLVLVFWASW
ncbi:MAG: redoxin domain-containing protein [Actinobacteria bacterium]|nr:redoxin domain-containing protein [Actinomycetota bacterium]